MGSPKSLLKGVDEMLVIQKDAKGSPFIKETKTKKELLRYLEVVLTNKFITLVAVVEGNTDDYKKPAKR